MSLLEAYCFSKEVEDFLGDMCPIIGYFPQGQLTNMSRGLKHQSGSPGLIHRERYYS